MLFMIACSEILQCTNYNYLSVLHMETVYLVSLLYLNIDHCLLKNLLCRNMMFIFYSQYYVDKSLYGFVSGHLTYNYLIQALYLHRLLLIPFLTKGGYCDLFVKKCSHSIFYIIEIHCPVYRIIIRTLHSIYQT